MAKLQSRNDVRLKRHARVRRKISGTPECPRLNVFRSNAHIHAQIIDDVNGVTLVSASSVEMKLENGGNIAAATAVGKAVAEAALAKNIKKVVIFFQSRSYYIIGQSGKIGQNFQWLSL